MHEWRMSLCVMFAVAAISTPLLLFFGLKSGVMNTLINRMLGNPSTMELMSVNERRLDSAWFDEHRKDPKVSFVIPRTRRLSASAEFRTQQGGKAVLDLIPTAAGDPLITHYSVAVPGYDECVLSNEASKRLNAKAGDQMELVVSRDRAKVKVTRKIRVSGILPESAGNVAVAYITLDSLEQIESFKDGFAVPELGWAGVDSKVYPVTPKAVIVTDAQLDPVREAMLTQNTGFSSAKFYDRKYAESHPGFIRKIHPLLKDNISIYELSTVNTPAQQNDLKTLKDRVRGMKNTLVIPYNPDLTLTVGEHELNIRPLRGFGADLPLDESFTRPKVTVVPKKTPEKADNSGNQPAANAEPEVPAVKETGDIKNDKPSVDKADGTDNSDKTAAETTAADNSEKVSVKESAVENSPAVNNNSAVNEDKPLRRSDTVNSGDSAVISTESDIPVIQAPADDSSGSVHDAEVSAAPQEEKNSDLESDAGKAAEAASADEKTDTGSGLSGQSYNQFIQKKFIDGAADAGSETDEAFENENIHENLSEKIAKDSGAVSHTLQSIEIYQNRLNEYAGGVYLSGVSGIEENLGTVAESAGTLKIGLSEVSEDGDGMNLMLNELETAVNNVINSENNIRNSLVSIRNIAENLNVNVQKNSDVIGEIKSGANLLLAGIQKLTDSELNKISVELDDRISQLISNADALYRTRRNLQGYTDYVVSEAAALLHYAETARLNAGRICSSREDDCSTDIILAYAEKLTDDANLLISRDKQLPAALTAMERIARYQKEEAEKLSNQLQEIRSVVKSGKNDTLAGENSLYEHGLYAVGLETAKQQGQNEQPGAEEQQLTVVTDDQAVRELKNVLGTDKGLFTGDYAERIFYVAPDIYREAGDLPQEVAVTYSGRKDNQIIERTVNFKALIRPLPFDAGDSALTSLSLIGQLGLLQDREITDGIASDGKSAFMMKKRGYTGFRMYASSLDNVVQLQDQLTSEGIKTMSRSDRISEILSLDHYLSLLFLLIAAASLTGAVCCLIANVYAGVERKRKELAILRLLGVHGSQLCIFPIFSSLLLTLGGVILSLIIFYILAYVVNACFVYQLSGNEKFCELQIEHIVNVFIISLSIASFAGLVASRRVMRIDPSDSLRDE